MSLMEQECQLFIKKHHATPDGWTMLATFSPQEFLLRLHVVSQKTIKDSLQLVRPSQVHSLLLQVNQLYQNCKNPKAREQKHFSALSPITVTNKCIHLKKKSLKAHL